MVARARVLGQEIEVGGIFFRQNLDHPDKEG
ncbi:MAG: hypothetical protein RLZZ224_1519 [Verrucomicrobiota bacterium]|jgi:hypothetical protein